MTACPHPLGGCWSPPALGAGARKRLLCPPPGRRISSGSNALKGRFFCSHAAEEGTSCWVLGSDIFVSGSMTWLLCGWDRLSQRGIKTGGGFPGLQTGDGPRVLCHHGKESDPHKPSQDLKDLRVPLDSSLCDATLGTNLAKMLKGQSCPNTICKAWPGDVSSAVRSWVQMSS